MISLGIYNGGDLRALSKDQLYFYFKNKSDFYYNIARGIDNTEVLEYNIRKSISSEKTYYIPKLKQELLDELDTLISKNINIIKNNSVLVKTIILKYKLSDLKTYTKSLSLISPTDTSKVLYESSHFLLNQISITLPIRLLGISYTNLVSKEDYILTNEKNYEQLIFNCS